MDFVSRLLGREPPGPHPQPSGRNHGQGSGRSGAEASHRDSGLDEAAACVEEEGVEVSAPVAAFERPLTSREVQVLVRIAGGKTNAEIAAELILSEETIKSHVRHLLAKLGARSRAHAVALGFQTGWLSIGSPER